MERFIYPDLSDLQPRVTTTDASKTTLSQVLLLSVDGDKWCLEMEVMGKTSNALEVVTAKVSAMVYRRSGAVLMANFQKALSQVTLTTCDVNIVISGDAVNVEVTGQAGKTINWYGKGCAWEAA